MNAIAKNDAALADSAHAAERAQIIANIETAEDLRSNALISALRMTVTLGATSKEEVAASWSGTRRSRLSARKPRST
jgi:hypothetical protein